MNQTNTLCSIRPNNAVPLLGLQLIASPANDGLVCVTGLRKVSDLKNSQKKEVGEKGRASIQRNSNPRALAHDVLLPIPLKDSSQVT